MSAVQKSHDQQSVRPRRSASRVLAVCSLLALGCGGEVGFIPSPAGTSTSDQGCIEKPWEWATQYGPATGATGGSLTVLADGTSIDVGWTDASFIGFTNAGRTDIYVRALDPNGLVLWTDQFGSEGWDIGIAVASPDRPTNPAPRTSSGSGPNGASLSGTQFSGGYFGAADAVAVDAMGRVYVGGRTVEPLEFCASVYIHLYSSSGDLLWSRVFGSPGNHAFRDIGFDGVGLVYVSGNTSDGLPGEVTTSESDRFIMRLRSIDL